MHVDPNGTRRSESDFGCAVDRDDHGERRTSAQSGEFNCKMSAKLVASGGAVGSADFGDLVFHGRRKFQAAARDPVFTVTGNIESDFMPDVSGVTRAGQEHSGSLRGVPQSAASGILGGLLKKKSQ